MPFFWSNLWGPDCDNPRKPVLKNLIDQHLGKEQKWESANFQMKISAGLKISHRYPVQKPALLRRVRPARLRLSKRKEIFTLTDKTQWYLEEKLSDRVDSSTSRVWRATSVDNPDAPPIALKIFRNQFVLDSAKRGFQYPDYEYQVHSIKSPYLVEFLGKGVGYFNTRTNPDDTHSAYIAMAYVPGLNLKELMKQPEKIEYDQVPKIITQILMALRALHASNVLHMDIKTSNIMIDDSMGVKIVDFGIITVISRPQITGMTEPFSPPEILRHSPRVDKEVLEKIPLVENPPSPSSDLYSLGVVISHLERARALVHQIVPYKIRRLRKWLMEPYPKDRPQSAEEALRFLHPILWSRPACALRKFLRKNF